MLRVDGFCSRVTNSEKWAEKPSRKRTFLCFALRLTFVLCVMRKRKAHREIPFGRLFPGGKC